MPPTQGVRKPKTHKKERQARKTEPPARPCAVDSVIEGVAIERHADGQAW